MPPSTISGINQLPYAEKREIYRQIIPEEVCDRFHLSPYLLDDRGRDLIQFRFEPGSSATELSVYHKYGFPDPVVYGHIVDTMTGNFHVLFYVLNDPDSPRFDIDRLADGTSTQYGTSARNLEAEQQAMEAGYSPGQVRRGLGLAKAGIRCFEQFCQSMGKEFYFAEPLHYHNAIIFERFGFSYQQGKRLMDRIQTGFAPGGDLLAKLDGSTPFRCPEAANSIHLRSWAVHDGILGEPFDHVTMYKRTGHAANINTCLGCEW